MEMSKEQLMATILAYVNDDGLDKEYYQWCKENVVCVEEGEDVVERKTVYNSDVYKVGDCFFEVTFTRDNCGYWGDGERYPPEIQEVVPKTVTKTIYVTKK